jgi:signal transduction histidine kinase
LIIFIFTLAAFSAAMSFIYQGFVFNEKEKALALGGREVSRQIVAYKMGDIGREDLEVTMDSVGYVMDSRIYALELDKDSLLEQQATLQEQNLTGSNLIPDLNKIMAGSEVFRKQEYSVELDSYVVFHGMPWQIDGEVKGAVLQYSPVEKLRSGILRMYMQIWLVGVFISILSAVVIYCYSANVSKPLRAMEKAAAQLASGQTVEDIKVVSTNDEVGRLVVAFNTMKQKLEQIENMRRDFIAGISHELRTPLTSILGFVQGIQDGLVPQNEVNGVISIVQDETRRMINLTGEILELVKLESGTSELYLERFRLFEALTFIIGSLNINEKRPGLIVEMICPEDLYITADADRFRQIMLNLLSNAIKYTEAPGNILVEVEAIEGMVKISVTDSGSGIEADEIPFVFERFYRTDKSRHSNTGGAGLGLNLTKVLVEQHKGSIGLESEVGVGTKIWFAIPIENHQMDLSQDQQSSIAAN